MVCENHLQSREMCNRDCSDGMETRQVIEQTANEVIRSSSLDLISTEYRTLCIISECQLRESIHEWLSPPNPSTNHNIACGTHHKKTAAWFFGGENYRDWKSRGSLLWVYGKRVPCPNFPYDHSDDILVCSWLGKEHSLVSAFIAPSIISCRRLPLVPRSSKILNLYARPVKHRWPISISTSGTPINNPCSAYSLLFSHNFLLALAPSVTFYPNFISITTTEGIGQVTVF